MSCLGKLAATVVLVGTLCMLIVCVAVVLAWNSADSTALVGGMLALAGSWTGSTQTLLGLGAAAGIFVLAFRLFNGVADKTHERGRRE